MSRDMKALEENVRAALLDAAFSDWEAVDGKVCEVYVDVAVQRILTAIEGTP